jgi:hypothetical protein
MWTYNMSYLAHANHKYIDRYMGPSGKYIYVYDRAVRAMGKIPKVVSNAQRRVKDYIDNRYYVQKGTDASGNKTYKLTNKDATDGSLNNKSFEEQQEIQQKEKYRNTLLEQLKTGDKVAAERRRASITDSSQAREREQSRSVEVTRAMQKKQQQEKAAKQAESEHRRTTNVADSQNARQAAINKSILKNRQLEAAKQQEAERKAASRQDNVKNAQSAREAAISKSSQKVQDNKKYDILKNEAENKFADYMDAVESYSDWADGLIDKLPNLGEIEKEALAAASKLNAEDKAKYEKEIKLFKEELEARRAAHKRGEKLTSNLPSSMTPTQSSYRQKYHEEWR